MKKLLFFLISFVLLFSCGTDAGEKRPKDPSKPSPFPPSYPKPSPKPLPGTISIIDQQTFISFHKLKRCWHSVDALTWNAEIAQSAQSWANKCQFRKDPDNTMYGENIGHGKNLGIIKVQDDWYMQFLYFPYGAPNGSSETEEFSQMVWFLTVTFGCGISKCGDETFYVCRYAPKGNTPGRYAYHVFPIKKDISKCGL